MKNSNDSFHLGNLLKKHIYLRNKTIKEVASYLDINEKTFSDHLNDTRMSSHELFKIADYLDLSLDYLGDMSRNKPGLLGQKVYRLSNHKHQEANVIVTSELERIKAIDYKDTNYVINELKKAFGGLGYVIDALLPLKNDDTNEPYDLYVKNSRIRGNINSGEYVIWPPFGQEMDMNAYENFLNGQNGIDFLKIVLRNLFKTEGSGDIMKITFNAEEIHTDFEKIDSKTILKLWNGKKVLRNKDGDIISAKQGGPGLREFIYLEYSRSEYYYVLGMRNLDKGNYYEALVDFNTAIHIYNNDLIVIETYRTRGRSDMPELFETYDTTSKNHGHNVFSECDIYLGKIKTLQHLGLYNEVIKTILSMMSTSEFKEYEQEDNHWHNEYVIEPMKHLLDAYIKEKEYEKALKINNQLLESVDFRSAYNLRFVKALIYEKLGDYNNALASIEDDYIVSGLLDVANSNDKFLNSYKFEYMQAAKLGNRLLQTMRDKNIPVTVKSFLDNDDEDVYA